MAPSRSPDGQVEQFGRLSSGETVHRVRLSSDRLQVDLLNYGARVASVRAPDRDGALGEVTLGFADAGGYEADGSYMGATVGRYANRIADGRFTLDGQTYEIPANEAGNALHGGTAGFDRKLWDFDLASPSSVSFHRLSPDGEMGFPGELDVIVVFAVVGPNLDVRYEARTTKPTVVNLTNHTYFNLAGGGSVEEHVIAVDADSFLAVDDRMIPTGEQSKVDGTPFDLREASRLGAHLRVGHEQLVKARGLDHTWVLWSSRPNGDPALRTAAFVEDPRSGRSVRLETDRPGVQVYSGNFLDGSEVGRDGLTYRQGDAFCLEPQYFPNSPNIESFPSTVLRPGDVYTAHDVYRFG